MIDISKVKLPDFFAHGLDPSKPLIVTATAELRYLIRKGDVLGQLSPRHAELVVRFFGDL